MKGQNPEHWDTVSCTVRNEHIDMAQAAVVALIQTRCFGGDRTVILSWWLTDQADLVNASLCHRLTIP